MTWTKLDDKFDDNPKLLEAIDVVGDSAGWLWVRAVNYCNKHLTDGFLPRAAVARLTTHKKPDAVAGALVAAGAWDVCDGGYRVHDFLDWNDSREKVLAAVEAAKRRKGDWRSRRKGGESGEGDGGNGGQAPPGDAEGTRSLSVPDTPRERQGTLPSPLLSSPLLSTPGDKSPKKPEVAGGLATPAAAVRAKRPRPDIPDGAYQQVVASYFAAFESVRGSKPVFGPIEGKAAKRLLERVSGDAGVACGVIVAAFRDPFWSRTQGSLVQIAADPNRFMRGGGGNDLRAAANGRQPRSSAWTEQSGEWDGS